VCTGTLVHYEQTVGLSWTGDACWTLVHGMFIDILTKLLIGIPPTTGKQQAVFCSKNAGEAWRQTDSIIPSYRNRICETKWNGTTNHVRKIARSSDAAIIFRS